MRTRVWLHALLALALVTGLRAQGGLGTTGGVLSNRIGGGTEPLTGGAGGFTIHDFDPGTNNSFGSGQGAGGNRSQRVSAGGARNRTVFTAREYCEWALMYRQHGKKILDALAVQVAIGGNPGMVSPTNLMESLYDAMRRSGDPEGTKQAYDQARRDLLERLNKALDSAGCSKSQKPPGVDQGGATGVDELGARAGPSSENPTAYTARTRWETVKDWIRKFMESYVNGDLSGVVGTLSKNFIQDWTILRQAIQEDFKNQTNINVDVQLLEFRMSFDTVVVRIKWSRTATNQDNGQTVIETGTSRLLFDRHDGLRLTGWFISSPFGLFTVAWQSQVAAGDPNAGGSLGIQQASIGGSQWEPFGSPGGIDHFSVDIEGAAPSALVGSDEDTEGHFGPNPPRPGADVMIHFNVSGCFGGNCFHEIGTDTALDGISPGYPTGELFPCPGTQAMENYSGIDTGPGVVRIPSFNVPDAGTFTRTFGVRSGEGNYGFVEVTWDGGIGAPPYQNVTVRWINFGSDPLNSGFSGSIC